jgi:hypothetical protein
MGMQTQECPEQAGVSGFCVEDQRVSILGFAGPMDLV